MFDVGVVVNPNNPDGRICAPGELGASRGGAGARVAAG